MVVISMQRSELGRRVVRCGKKEKKKVDGHVPRALWEIERSSSFPLPFDAPF